MQETEEPQALVNVEVSPELSEMIAAHPLPENVPDADMNQDELAGAFNVSGNTIKKWLTAGMPTVEVGGPGKSYVLRLSHCYAWRNARKQEDEARALKVQASIIGLQASFLNLAPTDEGAHISAKERRALAEADLVFSKAAQVRRELVRMEEVSDMIEAVFKIIRDGIEAMPDRLERELGLKPDQIETVSRIGNDILNAMTDEIEERELTSGEFEEVDLRSTMVI